MYRHGGREIWKYIYPKSVTSPRAKPEGNTTHGEETNLHISLPQGLVNCWPSSYRNSILYYKKHSNQFQQFNQLQILSSDHSAWSNACTAANGGTICMFRSQKKGSNDILVYVFWTGHVMHLNQSNALLHIWGIIKHCAFYTQTTVYTAPSYNYVSMSNKRHVNTLNCGECRARCQCRKLNKHHAFWRSSYVDWSIQFRELT